MRPRTARHRAGLPWFISIWNAPRPSRPYLAAAAALCRRGRPWLPPFPFFPPPPAARAFVWPGGALGASKTGNWRPEQANRTARPSLMSRRSRGEGAVRPGCGAREGASVTARTPRWPSGSRPAPSHSVAGTGAPNDILLPSPMRSPARSNYPAAVPRPPAAPEPPPRPRRSARDGTLRQEGAGSGAIRRAAGDPSGPEALGQRHWGEGMPPGSDAGVPSSVSTLAAAKPAPA